MKPKAHVFLIESSRANAPSFAPALQKKGYAVSIFHQLEAAAKAAQKDLPDLVVLDAASKKTSGVRMCRKIRERLPSTPIILISPQGSYSRGGNGDTLTLVQPFTPRKLLNRVARLIPGDERYSLEAGPINLNLSQRKVRCMGKEARLTPKQAKLLEVFMKSPGKIMTRKALIRQVWDTDYTGDTRTLDVHMSWLRKSIEPDPNLPILFKTIRGVGYWLELPDSS